MKCNICNFHIPNVRIFKERGKGTKLKDICKPCMDLIALIPDYKYEM